MRFTVRVRQDGSIGIPVLYRQRLGIQPGGIMAISTDRQGRIWLKPEPAVCSCCQQGTTYISHITGMCAPCQKLVELYIQDGGDMNAAIMKARKTGRDTGG